MKESPKEKLLYPNHGELFRTIRYFVDIDEQGIVNLRIKRGYSGEPYPEFDGKEFDFTAIAGGTAYRGNDGKSGRVVFPLGLTAKTIPDSQFLKSQNLSGPDTRNVSFGWTYNTAGMEWTNRPFSRFTERLGVSHAGFSITKNQKLPVSLRFEIVDGPSWKLPALSITVRTKSPGKRQKYIYNGSGKAGYVELQVGGHITKINDPGNIGNAEKAWTFSCIGKRQEDDSILFTVNVQNPISDILRWNENPVNNVIPNKNEVLARGKSMEKNLILNRLQNDYQNVCNVTYSVHTRSEIGKSSGERSQFELTYLDMIGNFEGTNDLLFELVKNRLPVKNSEMHLYTNNPFNNNYLIEGVNGTNSPQKIVELLNNLKFGDPITLNVKNNLKNRSSPPSEDRIIYAQ